MNIPFVKNPAAIYTGAVANKNSTQNNGGKPMRKMFAVIFCIAVAASVSFNGCKKAGEADKKAAGKTEEKPKIDLKVIEKDFCDVKKMTGLLYSDAFGEFMGRAQYAAELSSRKPEKTEEDYVKNVVGDMKQDMGGEMFSACGKVEAKEIKCEDAFKQLAAERYGPGKMVRNDPEKAVAAIGEKMGITNCVMLSVTATSTSTNKEDTGKVYAGDFKGTMQAFWVVGK
jgi:hypothetical protein